MKKLLVLALALGVAACSDTATGPLPDVPDIPDIQPQLVTTIGSGATWSFQATIYDALDPALVNKPVTGSFTFEIAPGDLLGNPCIGLYRLRGSVTYTLDGEEYTVGGRSGRAMSYTSCIVETPFILANVGDASMSAGIQLANPADTQDFPLTPPPLVGWPNIFTVADASPNPENEPRYYFYALVSSLHLDPVTKGDCMKDDWAKYGFKNQGQCVRFIETGKDSR